MRKQWLGIGIAAALLAACNSNDNGQQPVNTQPVQPAVCTGPVTEISGADVNYEALNPTANQDYQRDGKTYKIVQDPSNFSQKGLAAIYDAEPNSNLTASGEAFDPNQFTAAHPTLPIPSYVRVTNLANGRMLVVRINDRGPFGNDRVISLSRAAADRLNTSNNTKVQIDPIIVAQDGNLSGPGTNCTTVAKQTYALPARPDLNSGMGSASSMPQDTTSQSNVRAISNDGLKSDSTEGVPVNSNGFLGAPTPLKDGVVESAAPVVAIGAAATAAATTEQPTDQSPIDTGTRNAPITAPGSVQGSVAPAVAPAVATPTAAAPAASASGQFVVQVGAVSDAARASQWQQKLSQQFGVPGLVSHNGAVYRVQMGPFASKAQAQSLQQRLLSEAQQQSFVTVAPAQ